jgi:hypothetical protein
MACVRDMLWHDHLLHLAEEDIGIRIGRVAADSHRSDPGMTCLEDRSPR